MDGDSEEEEDGILDDDISDEDEKDEDDEAADDCNRKGLQRDSCGR